MQVTLVLTIPVLLALVSVHHGLLYGCFARGVKLPPINSSAQDRPALLPAASEDALRRHVEWLAQRHAAELKAGFGEGDVPDALARKIPSAARSLGWQYVLLGLVGVVSPLDR